MSGPALGRNCQAATTLVLGYGVRDEAGRRSGLWVSVLDVLRTAFLVLLIVSIPEGSRRFEGFLQQNGVAEPVARYARYAGYVLAALLMVAFVGLVAAAVLS